MPNYIFDSGDEYSIKHLASHRGWIINNAVEFNIFHPKSQIIDLLTQGGRNL